MSPPTLASLSMTLPFATRLRESRTIYSQNSTISHDSFLLLLSQMELNTIHPMASNQGRTNWIAPVEASPQKYVTTSTPHLDANSPNVSAATSTSASLVARVAISATNALPAPRSDSLSPPWHGIWPKFLHYNIWIPDADFTPMIADWSETVLSLPQPPLGELDDSIVSRTMCNHPELFKIVIPINVNVFKDYLSYHPNPDFIQSVCTGLCEGFWPWADTHQWGYPEMICSSFSSLGTSW